MFLKVITKSFVNIFEHLLKIVTITYTFGMELKK